MPNAQQNQMEPLLVVVQPKEQLQEDKPHEGEEFGYVISGRIRLHLGDKSYVVNPVRVFISGRIGIILLKIQAAVRQICLGEHTTDILAQ